MADGQGFSSLSIQKRREASSKGGKTSQAKGTAHKLNSADAKLAAAKSTEKRRRKASMAAALKLMALGFSAEDLTLLQLTVDEYIYFGGAKASMRRYDVLKQRLEAFKNL